MSATIGNPGSWAVDHVKSAGTHLGTMVGHVGSGHTAGSVEPRVRHLAVRDLRDVLRKGYADFSACRTDVVCLAVLYPLIGLILVSVATHRTLVPLVFPMMSGFALLGPLAAVGLYEMSRRREMGEQPRWSDAFAVAKSPSFGAVLSLGLLLFALFFVWILAAHGIYMATMGPAYPSGAGDFLRAVFGTAGGWTLIVVGCGVGLLFAMLALAISVVSFPLLLDRDVGLPTAVITSIRVAAANPVPIAAWGLIVAGLLALGSIPLFLGLVVVMPVLGHATWHLYRRTVVAEPSRDGRASVPGSD